jgi:hypothetical protein
MRFLLGALVALVLCACGGGAAPDPAPQEALPATLRTDVEFTYYGDCDECLYETDAHTTLYWVFGWGAQGVEGHLSEAVQKGKRVVLASVPAYPSGASNEDAVRGYFMRLDAMGLLQNIIALYPIDEPDKNVAAAAVVVQTNAMLRKVMAEFPALHNTKLAAIYSCTGSFAGVESYDWVGCDDYGQGAGMLAGQYERMKARLTRPEQRIMLVPGGTSPWRTDPEPFYIRAMLDPKVVAIVGFLWRDYSRPNGFDGIAVNPEMAAAYCRVGARVKGNSKVRCSS